MDDVPVALAQLDHEQDAAPGPQQASKPAALPAGWEAVRDDTDGTEYYYCEETGELTQERPVAGERRQDVAQELANLLEAVADDDLAVRLVVQRKEAKPATVRGPASQPLLRSKLMPLPLP